MSDPFALLGVEPTFNLDTDQIEKTVRELSRALHPDQHTGAPNAARRDALSRAIDVNSAWRQLKDPVTRAEALLEHLGVHLDEASEPKIDPMFLMEILEKREALSGARRTRDVAGLGDLVADIRTQEAATEKTPGVGFRDALAAKTQGAPLDSLLPTLRAELARLRYFKRFLEEAAVAQEDLD
jgi:molecular chaperone HscB